MGHSVQQAVDVPLLAGPLTGYGKHMERVEALLCKQLKAVVLLIHILWLVETQLLATSYRTWC